MCVCVFVCVFVYVHDTSMALFIKGFSDSPDEIVHVHVYVYVDMFVCTYVYMCVYVRLWSMHGMLATFMR